MFESQVYPYDGPILFQTFQDIIECEGDDLSQFHVHVCVHVHVDSVLRPYPWKYIHFSNWSRHSQVLRPSLGEDEEVNWWEGPELEPINWDPYWEE